LQEYKEDFIFGRLQNELKELKQSEMRFWNKKKLLNKVVIEILLILTITGYSLALLYFFIKNTP
jgi:hypothetical protein